MGASTLTDDDRKNLVEKVLQLKKTLNADGSKTTTDEACKRLDITKSSYQAWKNKFGFTKKGAFQLPALRVHEPLAVPAKPSKLRKQEHTHTILHNPSNERAAVVLCRSSDAVAVAAQWLAGGP